MIHKVREIIGIIGTLSVLADGYDKSFLHTFYTQFSSHHTPCTEYDDSVRFRFLERIRGKPCEDERHVMQIMLNNLCNTEYRSLLVSEFNKLVQIFIVGMQRIDNVDNGIAFIIFLRCMNIIPKRDCHHTVNISEVIKVFGDNLLCKEYELLMVLLHYEYVGLGINASSFSTEEFLKWKSDNNISDIGNDKVKKFIFLHHIRYGIQPACNLHNLLLQLEHKLNVEFVMCVVSNPEMGYESVPHRLLHAAPVKHIAVSSTEDDFKKGDSDVCDSKIYVNTDPWNFIKDNGYYNIKKTKLEHVGSVASLKEPPAFEVEKKKTQNIKKIKKTICQNDISVCVLYVYITFTILCPFFIYIEYIMLFHVLQVNKFLRYENSIILFSICIIIATIFVAYFIYNIYLHYVHDEDICTECHNLQETRSVEFEECISNSSSKLHNNNVLSEVKDEATLDL